MKLATKLMMFNNKIKKGLKAINKIYKNKINLCLAIWLEMQ